MLKRMKPTVNPAVREQHYSYDASGGVSGGPSLRSSQAYPPVFGQFFLQYYQGSHEAILEEIAAELKQRVPVDESLLHPSLEQVRLRGYKVA